MNPYYEALIEIAIALVIVGVMVISLKIRERRKQKVVHPAPVQHVNCRCTLPTEHDVYKKSCHCGGQREGRPCR
jgi:hypothetical protein